MIPRQRDLLTASLLALAAWGLYVGFLSKAYVFEGLIRAMPIDTGRWPHLFPGNYLLYGPLGLLFHTFLQLLGVNQPAVISLQLMDTLLGAAGVFVFYFTLRKLGGDVFSSGVWSTVLGVSLGYWLWSTDAENYILSTFLLLLNFYFLVRYWKEGRKDPIVLGAVHGVAILGHIVNTLFGVVILWVLTRVHGKKWIQPALRYAGAAALVALGAYGGVLLFIRKPASFHDVVIWFAGSAGKEETFSLGGPFSAAKFEAWLKMSLHILGSFAPEYHQPPPWEISAFLLWVGWLLIGIFAGVFLGRFRKIYRKYPAVVGGCALWLFVYACVFTRWEPGTMVYRVSDLVPMCVLLFLAYQEVDKRRWARGAAVLLAGSLAIGNLGAEIYPRSFASNNPDLQRMVFLKANTVEGNWITGGSGLDEIYIPYFAARRPIVIEQFTKNHDRLVVVIDTLLARGESVFVTSRVLDVDAWKVFFQRYKLSLKAHDEKGFALYKIGR